MTQKIKNFIAASSERSRKVIAGITVGFAGIMLFFVWTAGVSARLPLLGSEFTIPAATDPDSRLSLESGYAGPVTVSPMRGLIDSFQGLARLFQGEYSAGSPSADGSSRVSYPSTPPIQGLFEKIADEARVTDATTTVREDLPPADELPGL